MNARIAVIGLLFLASCSSPPQTAPVVPLEDATAQVDVLLLGEQHDAASHQKTHRRVVEALAAKGRLAALALEMAEQGASTVGLPPGTTEGAIQAALRWNDAAWPWAAYGPAVMAAVSAGVPVIGANLSRADMLSAMTDDSLDRLLPGPALKAQQQAIRLGHCNQLPETQIGPMTRIQIARDRSMARTLSDAVAAGKTVVLLAGAGHVDESVGIPRYLEPTLRFRSVTLTPEPQARDYCADLKERRQP